MPRNPLTHPLAGITMIAAVALTAGLVLMQGTGSARAPQAALAERAEAWAPLRSVASWALWRVLELDSFDAGA